MTALTVAQGCLDNVLSTGRGGVAVQVALGLRELGHIDVDHRADHRRRIGGEPLCAREQVHFRPGGHPPTAA
jgi:hypothetical protein